MTTYNITISIGARHTAEPTTWFDWVSFIWMCIVTLILIVWSICIIIYRKKVPIRTKALTLLVLSGVFGIIHMWSAFASNDHFKFFNEHVLKYNCELWSFWLQYGLGLFPWFTIQLIRIHKVVSAYSKIPERVNRVFTNGTKENSVRKWALIYIILINVPVILICLYTTLTHSSVFMKDQLECNTNVAVKLAILFLIIFCVLLLVILTLFVKRRIKSIYINEYNQNRDRVMVSVVILLIVAAIHFTGLNAYSVGRNIFINGICFLHLYNFMRVAWYSTWQTIRNEHDYTSLIVSSVVENDILKGKSIKEYILEDPQHKTQFTLWCRMQDDKVIEDSLLPNNFRIGRSVISARRLISFLNDLEMYFSLYCDPRKTDTDSEGKSYYKNNIVATYFNYNNQNVKNPPFNFKDEMLLKHLVNLPDLEKLQQAHRKEFVESYILDMLIDIYGESYMADMSLSSMTQQPVSINGTSGKHDAESYELETMHVFSFQPPGGKRKLFTK